MSLTTQQLQALERAWLLGTQRGPAPVPDGYGDDDGLAALAYRAQQLQLTVSAPTSRQAPTWVEAPADARPTFPDALRPALRRLVAGAETRGQLEVLAPVAWWMRDHGVRLHPFDTWAMGKAAFDPCVGDYEGWLAAQGGRTVRDDRVPAATDQTWTQLGPVSRERWLRARRRQSPDDARALLEACWGHERADVRLRLLDALEEQLSEADRPFLEGLDTDRSQKVQQRARELLALVPGTDSHAERIAALAQVLTVKRPILGKRRLQLAPGADVLHVMLALCRLHPAHVARDLGFDPKLLTGGGDAPALAPAFAAGALYHDDREWMERLVAPLAGKRQPLSVWLEVLDDDDPARNRVLAERLLVGDAAAALAENPAEAAEWVTLLQGPLPLAGSRAMRQSRSFTALLDGLLDAEKAGALEQLTQLAPLVHPGDASAALTALQAKGATAAPLIQALWRLLAHLNEVSP